MKRFLLMTLCFVTVMTVFALLAPQSQSKAEPAPQYPAQTALPTNQMIIKYKTSTDLRGPQAADGAERLAQLSQVAGVSLTYFRPMSGDAHVLRLPQRYPLADVQAMAAKLAQLPDVEYAEADGFLQIDDQFINPVRIYANSTFSRIPGASPNDPQYSAQWHYRYTAGSSEGINAEPAWSITTGSPSLVIAILDTGQLNHADLAGRMIAGYDMLSDPVQGNDGDGRDSDPSDPGDWTSGECGSPHNSSWHGTHVAGTIAAATDNNMGVAGINWVSKIQHVRVLGTCGGSYSDIADGITWAAGLPVPGTPVNSTPAKVLNMSLGGGGSCPASMQSAINGAVAAGSVVIVAAGNENEDASLHTPANCNNVITVASNGPTGDKASYSNYGSVVEVTGPGGDMQLGNTAGVLSTLNTGTTSPSADAYVYYQGTSMATPHVVGVASLLLSICPTYTPAQVLARLQATVRPFPNGSSCNTSICGSGIVDVTNVLTGLTCSAPATHRVYLPIARRAGSVGPTPTPTVPGPTPTPTMTPTPPPSGLVNGNFESGQTGWTESSSHNYPLIVNNFDPTGVTPHGGSWAAWLGGDNDEISNLSQTVTVPTGGSYLSYWYWFQSTDVCGFDLATVKVNGTVVAQADLCDTNNTNGWAHTSLDLSSYAGQTVTLTFGAETDSSILSNFFVDDVSFQSTP